MSNKYKLEGESRGFSIGGIGRFLALIIVVIVGIYLASTIEEWNFSRQKVKLERVYLNELLTEAEKNHEQLIVLLQAQSKQLELFGYLLENQNRTVGPDTLSMAVSEINKNQSFTIHDAVFDLFISSSEIDLIKSESIFQSLVDFKNASSRISNVSAIEQRVIEDKIEPYLINEGVLSLLETLTETDEINISTQQIDRIIRVLLNDRKFVDLVYLRYSRLKDVIDMENSLKQDIQNLIDLLESEIETIESNR